MTNPIRYTKETELLMPTKEPTLWGRLFFRFKHPHICEFRKITEKKQILSYFVSFREDINKGNLFLTVEDNTKEVQKHQISGFKLKYRSDIDKLIIDIDAGIMYMPYEKG